MESLKDLGADTPYGQNGLPLLVDPAVEAQVQPNCTAIDNWAVHARQGDRDPRRGAAGAMGPAELRDRPVRTDDLHAERPCRCCNGTGQPTGATISGATTIELTAGAAPARGAGQQAVDPGRDARRSRSPTPRPTGSARCAARPTTSTATTSSGSPTRRTRRTCSASRTTSSRRRRAARSPSARRSRCRRTRPRRRSASPATSPTRTTSSSSPSSNGKTDSISFIRAGGIDAGTSRRRSRRSAKLDRHRLHVEAAAARSITDVDDRAHHGGAGAGRRRGLHVQEHVPATAVRPDAAQGQHRRHRHASASTSRARATLDRRRVRRDVDARARRRWSSRRTRSPTSRPAPTR